MAFNDAVAANNGTVTAAPSAVDSQGFFGAVTGTTLIIDGTSGNDTIAMQGFSGGFAVILNGNVSTYSTQQFHAAVFLGLGGTDFATLIATAGTASATVSPGRALLVGASYSFNANGAQTTNVFGNSASTANVSDSTGADVFYGEPAYSILANIGGNAPYSITVAGFGVVNATSSGGGDIAALYDSTGNDTYTADSTGSQMSGSGYVAHAARFPIAYGFFSFGGVDTANLSPNTTTKNYVYGTAADTVNFFDSAGDDTFYGLSTYSVMTSIFYWNEAIGFGTVNTTAVSGNDTAFLYDARGVNQLNASGSNATLANSQVTISVSGFDRVSAIGGNGTDREHIGAIDFVFNKYGTWLDD